MESVDVTRFFSVCKGNQCNRSNVSLTNRWHFFSFRGNGSRLRRHVDPAVDAKRHANVCFVLFCFFFCSLFIGLEFVWVFFLRVVIVSVLCVSRVVDDIHQLCRDTKREQHDSMLTFRHRVTTRFRFDSNVARKNYDSFPPGLPFLEIIINPHHNTTESRRKSDSTAKTCSRLKTNSTKKKRPYTKTKSEATSLMMEKNRTSCDDSVWKCRSSRVSVRNANDTITKMESRFSLSLSLSLSLCFVLLCVLPVDFLFSRPPQPTEQRHDDRKPRKRHIRDPLSGFLSRRCSNNNNSNNNNIEKRKTRKKTVRKRDLDSLVDRFPVSRLCHIWNAFYRVLPGFLGRHFAAVAQTLGLRENSREMSSDREQLRS